MADLLVIVPSRERPENIQELITIFNTTMTINADLLVAVDEDDPKLADYILLGNECSIEIADTHSMGEALNRAAKYESDWYKYIGFMGDDHRPRTNHWDRKLVYELQRTPIVYGNDLLQGEKLPTACFMQSDIIKKLGYMVPPTLTHMYMDNFWLELGKQIGIKYLSDVVIEHMHPIAGKAQWDDGYKRVNAQEMYRHDEHAFREYLTYSFPIDLFKLLEKETDDQAVA